MSPDLIILSRRRSSVFLRWIALCIGVGSMVAACGRKDAGDVPRASKADAQRATHDQTAAAVSETRNAAASAENHGTASDHGVDAIAERFVKLALGIGQHDPAFVDAYQGPEEWRTQVEAADRSLAQLSIDAMALINDLNTVKTHDEPARIDMMKKQLTAALTRIRMAQGKIYPFNEETRLLYDAVAPDYDLTEFDEVLFQIDQLLPGEGTTAERMQAFRASLAIPDDKLQPVFDAAITECRKRTLRHYDLPKSETFRLEFVEDKPWSGYNWYQGNYESLIQVNTDLPIIIDRAVDLGCHEGYPGHHTWNVLLERDVLKKKGWKEYYVYPLFSPLSVTAEGSANYGIDLAFPEEEKIAFERDVLFPIAGLDPSQAETLGKVNALRARLSHVRNHYAREYLDGRMSREDAIQMAMKYELHSRDRAEKTLEFIDTYRGYVINYNLGKDIVTDFIDARVSGGEDRWTVFETVLRTPTTASDLVAGTRDSQE